MAAAVVVTLGAIGAVGVGPAVAASAHDPILIVGDAGFTAANGVTNLPCGDAAKPCSVDNWEITPAAGGTCIKVDGSQAGKPITKSYVVHDNTCSGGTNGIMLVKAPNGKVTGNTVSDLRGTAGSPDATGISVDSSNTTGLTGNRLSKIAGNPGSAPGQAGGSAFGIRVRNSAPVEIKGNTISQVAGGFGSIGTAPSPKDGGNGGSAVAISAEKTTSAFTLLLGPVALHLEPPLSDLLYPVWEQLASVLGPMLVAPPNLNVQDNTISRVTGAVGAIGASGGTATGGNGGSGGNATGVAVSSTSTAYSGVMVTGNNVSTVLGGVGAVGGSGRSGGKGGVGGTAQGVALSNVSNTGSAVTGNTITQLYGAVGAIGGTGTLGLGTGGSGGNGGNAFGIRRSNVAVLPGGNGITFLFAGLGGMGGFPGGSNGANGTALAIVI